MRRLLGAALALLVAGCGSGANEPGFAAGQGQTATPLTGDGGQDAATDATTSQEAAGADTGTSTDATDEPDVDRRAVVVACEAACEKALYDCGTPLDDGGHDACDAGDSACCETAYRNCNGACGTF